MALQWVCDIPDADSNLLLTLILICYYNRHSRLPTNPPSRQYLLNVLDISHQYEVMTGINWVIYHLERLNDVDSPPDTPGFHAPLSPAHQLYIARRYQVQSWVKPAVFEIMEWFSLDAKQICLITDNDCNLMGYYAFGIIAKGIESINVERLMIAFCRGRHWPSI